MLMLPPGGELPSRVCVGFSGGLDSSVLLHCLRKVVPELRAIHVHHGLQADADAWAAHCVAVCIHWGIPIDVVHVQVPRDSGLGLEGAARAARHAAFADAMREGGTLALAHHRDDQAETFLLRALRASGPDGLAAMCAWQPRAGWALWRPLLATARDALLAYAEANGLEWIEDPSNAADDADRNFLRSRVLPVLRQRWPQVDAAFAASAALQAQLVERLGPATQATLQACLRDDGDLDIAALLGVPAAEQAAVLRHWVASKGLPPLPASGVTAVQDQLLAASADAEPRYRWQDADIRRWRERLHAASVRAPLPADFDVSWDGRAPCQLPTGDQLELVGVAAFDLPLRVTARHGGERITLPHRGHSHALKHVLQDSGVPPWERERLPLLRDGDTVLAAGEILSGPLQAWLAAHGGRLHWHRD